MLPTNHINNYLVKSHKLGARGLRGVYRFPNNYGASVVVGGLVTANQGNYYLELVVLRFHSEDDEDFSLDYDTPITDDIMIFDNEEELIRTLEAIKELW
ncbi:hypothetical protein F373_gp054 [Bacillus phage SP-10]|uniref:hypothetical protein n=1 Tax=Bacillus phage SP10 TaxID=941058 RepID=UPI0002198B0A|nr:hypothetical protein F373_gp054 [Bacillus phage SP-10]BAK52866.1 hypothetical protein [Bacillus phage SP-10]